MVTKTISYTNYNGEEVKETFYFNLSKAELMEMELSTAGGFSNKIKAITDAKNAPEVMSLFKDIILRSYGEKSADGRRLIKSKELSEAFTQTEAYSELLMDLLSDPNGAANFINGIMPKIENTNIPAPVQN